VAVHALRVGRCLIHKGDVGHVSTLPEFQRRGFGSVLMRDTASHLTELGCQIGRLGGLIAFHARFGWVPFPRRYYEFHLEPARGGTTVLQPDEYLVPPPGFRGRIMPFDPVRHHAGRVRLHQALYGQRTGALVVGFGDPPRPGTAKPDETGLRLACEHEGRLVGYLLGFARPAEHTSFEAQVEIGEVAYEYEHPDALGALVIQALRVAYSGGATRVTGRLPFDARVEDALRDSGVRYHLVEIQTAPASNMILIADVLRLLRAITPELEARLAESALADWTGEITFCLPDGQTAVLETKDGAVNAWDLTPSQFRVDLHPATMLKLVLGLRSFGECAQVQSVDDARRAQEVCNVLFPRQPTACGAWG
jgi:hypothetical protein